ncbi:uncharacterized protein LOC110829337 isoform X2 [Zootermopsis nevadensis]|uniref:Calcium release-activated calcium channel protein 1 n=2 Tax=Zootermopsis nevadensis TaxID=136037 RepID=A0A067RI76_ZOONE|nr:uncharacterized protein LOC110829337 isoform X2 [Zootermopsis nevadensis]KDR20115.1 Calcium release-activated calcium channel protein 1 [Zootermopsis nevadensis]
MSDITNGVESTASRSPAAAVDNKLLSTHQPLPQDISRPTLAGLQTVPNGDVHVRSTSSTHPTTQGTSNGSNVTTGSDSSIQGAIHRYYTDQQPLKTSMSRPTSFPDSQSPCRYPPSVLEESSISRRSQIDLLNSQQSVLKSSCEIPMTRTLTPSNSEPYYTSHRAIPIGLYKSMSSNNIPPPVVPYYPGRITQLQMRPWRYPSSSVARPVGLPYSISQQSLNSRVGCQCQCDSNRKQSGEGSSLTEEGAMTPEGLSWRRLHMSRAKLKATATTSELLSGFAMVAMVELQINEPTNVPEWLFVMFSVCTTVLVAVHIFALMISTYLLPNIDAISKLQVQELVSQSPHERMRGFIELAWAFSTVLGLFLFLVEVAILCWVKFWDYSFTAAWAATIIVIPVLIVFVAFAVHFYHNLVVYKCESTVTDLQKLENMKKHLDAVGCNPV